MDNIHKLRHLIWDTDKEVFADDEVLSEFLKDCSGNVYKAAALVLDIVRADPERITDYKRGGVTVTKQNLDRAVKKYEEIGGKPNYYCEKKEVHELILPKDKNFISVEIERFTGGSLDKTTGNWQDSDTVLVAEAEIDLQPKTGSGTDSFSDLSYNKTFTGFIGILDISFSTGFSKIMRGDIINKKYKVLDAKDWLTHYELLLEKV